MIVWRKSAPRSLLGSISDPVFYLLALGYGLGGFVGEVDGLAYVAFLGSGLIATNVMNTATFEGLYLAYTRMETQQTWESMLCAPVSMADVVFGEILWAGTKSTVSVSLFFLVLCLPGVVQPGISLLVIPAGFLGGLCFGSMALVVTSYSTSYEFFLYYMTLVVTPMILLSGVFFPLSSLPEALQVVSRFLPLQQLVEFVRAVFFGAADIMVVVYLLVPLLCFVFFSLFAVYRFRRRLLR